MSQQQQQSSSDTITSNVIPSTTVSDSTKTNNTTTVYQFWNLPDVVLFQMITYIAAPTNRANIICHVIAPLCKAAYGRVLQQHNNDKSDDNTNVNVVTSVSSASALWDILFIEDYGSCSTTDSSSNTGRIRQRRQQQQNQELNDPIRRECKRLRRSTIHRVRDAHKLICDNTEIAFFYLSEMVNCSNSGGNGNKLTKTRLVSLLHEYGPNLRFNRPVSSGGLYLVEVCRAKHVKEVIILKCVQELIENWSVQIDLRSSESNISTQTALCVAAARGLSTVVSYLVRRGACTDIISSGRFALHTRPKKTIRCIHQTALDFAITMRDAELAEGASNSALIGLNKCIKILSP